MATECNEGDPSIDLACLSVEDATPPFLQVSPLTDWECSPSRSSPSANHSSSLTASTAGSPAAIDWTAHSTRSPMTAELETKLRQRLLRSEVVQDSRNIPKSASTKRDGSRDGAHTPQTSQPPQRSSSRRSNASGGSAPNASIRSERQIMPSFEPVKLSSGLRRPPRAGALTRTMTEPEPLRKSPDLEPSHMLEEPEPPSPLVPMRTISTPDVAARAPATFAVLSEKYLRDQSGSLQKATAAADDHVSVDFGPDEDEDIANVCASMKPEMKSSLRTMMRPLLRELFQELSLSQRMDTIEATVQDLQSSTYVGFDEINSLLDKQAKDRHDVEKNHLSLLNRTNASVQANINKVKQIEQSMQGLVETVQKTREQMGNAESRFRSLNESILSKLHGYALDAIHASTGDLREDLRSTAADLQQKIELKANETCNLMDERWARVDKAAHDLPHMVERKQFDELVDAFKILQSGLDSKADLQAYLETKSRVGVFEVALEQKVSRTDISDMVANVMFSSHWKARSGAVRS